MEHDLTYVRRLYIQWNRFRFKSPVKLKKEVDAKYGTSAVEKMSLEEANSIYHEVISWASWNDMTVQDHMAMNLGTTFEDADEQHPTKYIGKLMELLGESADHLQRGRELGLTALEQRVVDTLWGWVPHNYQDNYVACAQAVGKVITERIPRQGIDTSIEGARAYITNIIEAVKALAAEYDVDFDTTKYNLTTGYFLEWLNEEYGWVNDDYLEDFTYYEGMEDEFRCYENGNEEDAE